MQKTTDKDRLLWLLLEQGGVSNAQAKSALDVVDTKFDKIKTELLDAGLIEKFRTRGGGLRLTPKGLSVKPSSLPISNVTNEKDLYPSLLSSLEREASENEDNALVIDTSSLRKSGKWSNPDLTKISVRHFGLIRSTKVLISTYEIKQFGRWNIEAGFEAASHRRFANHSYVVVEWSRNLPMEGLDDLKQVCGRFGVGLMTMSKHYTSWRHTVALEAESYSPPDEAVEEYLGYVLDRRKDCQQAFDSLWKHDK